MPIGDASNLRTASNSIVEPKGVDVAVYPKLILVAGAIEEYAPDDMPDRPDDQKAADQHEVASLLQQRLEIALEIRRTRARMLGILGLHQLLQIFPGDARWRRRQTAACPRPRRTPRRSSAWRARRRPTCPPPPPENRRPSASSRGARSPRRHRRRRTPRPRHGRCRRRTRRPVSSPRRFIGMKPLCCSSEPVEGVMENGKPSSFMARDSAALVGSLPRKKTWVSIDMALNLSATYDGTNREQSQAGLTRHTWASNKSTHADHHTVIAAISRSPSAASRASPASVRRPRSMATKRSHRVSACATFCSTSRMARPARFNSLRMA